MSNRRAGFVVMLVAINAGLFVQPLAAQQPRRDSRLRLVPQLGRRSAPAACFLSPAFHPTRSMSAYHIAPRCGLRTDCALD